MKMNLTQACCFTCIVACVSITPQVAPNPGFRETSLTASFWITKRALLPLFRRSYVALLRK